MKKLFVLLIVLLSGTTLGLSQIKTNSFGKGITFSDTDSTFYMKLNFRIQNLSNQEWEVVDGSLANHESNFLIRRSRLKMGGWAISPKLTYKFEMGLSNRDVRGGDEDEFGNTANLILDAWLSWNFYKNISIQFGQGKLPGNRERVISSANLQFVDRSRLNSRYSLDRDVGIKLKNHHIIGEKFLLREIIFLSQGEGRNIIIGYDKGYDYTFRLEALPFGAFSKNGDFVSSAIVREKTPKLSLGFTYDINRNAVRERGQLGEFINYEGTYFGKNLNSFFADMMFKYQNISVLAEYVYRTTEDGDPTVTIIEQPDTPIGTFYTGTGLNIQAGYMFDSNWEVAARFTSINPDEKVAEDESQYTLGISKFIAGHKLKVQTDFTYRAIDNKNNNVFWRTQVEFQF